jgi:hypothetical protein
VQVGDEMRQEIGAERGDDAHPDRAGERALGAAREIADVGDLAQDAASAGRDLGAPIGVITTRDRLRSTSCTPSRISSSRSCAESVGWVTFTLSAARRKCSVSARATR